MQTWKKSNARSIFELQKCICCKHEGRVREKSVRVVSVCARAAAAAVAAVFIFAKCTLAKVII